MFWKKHPDIIEAWYLKLDALAGRVATTLKSKPGAEKINLLFVSDHGFQNFNNKVNINRWLFNQGYITLDEKVEAQNLSAVDWSLSKAYAIGLNSVYLNLQGREGMGTIAASQKGETITRLRDKLLNWTGPDGSAVI
jgi:predicted AlkP superfamily phosphohydrolase/phosphomutase